MTAATPARTPVSRQRALAEAVALADSEGLDAVSMRNLAARLGVVPMALYKHVANKDDLLGGMLDLLIAGYAAPEPGLTWPGTTRSRILAARRSLLAHPWARQVIETRTTRTPQVLGHLEALTGDFLAGGVSPELTHHAMHVLGHRVWGFSPEAFQDPAALPLPPDPAARAEAVERLRAAYPHIATVALASVDGDLAELDSGCDEEFEFGFALDLILDAVQRLQAAGGRAVLG